MFSLLPVEEGIDDFEDDLLLETEEDIFADFDDPSALATTGHPQPDVPDFAALPPPATDLTEEDLSEVDFTEEDLDLIDFDSADDESETHVPVVGIQVVQHPPSIWYQFGEGPCTVQFKKNVDTTWDQAVVQLIYEDDRTPVHALSGEEQVVKILTTEVTDDVVVYGLKIHEITKNHRSRNFCVMVQLGDVGCTTTSFNVRTKRTKRKRGRDAVPVSEYNATVHSVVSQLQWRISGYVSTCPGSVDFSQPLYACPLCLESKSNGHTAECPIPMLLIK